ncbi:hypothetical protein SEA_ROSEPHARIE_77 [Streptomyces phage RosePharie]|nr:hypothetical protein SEA_ROSEPHARIE_77 [Streptomyces phage RosePharie]
MLHVDLQRAKELVAESIASRGADYTYDKRGGSCLYVHAEEVWNEAEERYELDYSTATPGCLVGDALKRGGIPLEAMGGEYTNDVDSNDLLSKLQARDFLTYTDSAAAYLSNAQTSQDKGAPWGRAASAAANGDTLEKVMEHDTDGKFWNGEWYTVPGLIVE